MNNPSITLHKAAAPCISLAADIPPLWHRFLRGSAASITERRVHSRLDAPSSLMAAATLRVANCIFDSIAGQRVLLVGLDAKIMPYAECFCAQHPKRITVVGHTLERARCLAGRIDGEAIRLDELPEQLPLHDIVVTCTASPLPILGKGMVERAIAYRKHRPMLIVDLAVPSDVEPEVGELDDVFLYTAADLARVVCDHRDVFREKISPELFTRGALLCEKVGRSLCGPE